MQSLIQENHKTELRYKESSTSQWTQKFEDGKPEYQGQKLKFYLSEKEYLKNHCVDIVKATVTCYEERYSSLLSDNNNESSGVSDDGH